jgi:hypothetical protein
LATPLNERLIHIEVDGINVTGPIFIPNTGAWDKWETVLTTVNLSQGEHALRVVFDFGGFNFNWLELNRIGYDQTAAKPVISPEGGSFYGNAEVSLTCTTPGASIYYTLDGSTPDSSAIQYLKPLTVAEDTTIKATAVADGYNDSDVSIATFIDAASGDRAFKGSSNMIPGIIEAEDYDTTGEGVAYHDTSHGNKGAKYRNDDVDIWYSTVEGHYTGANATSEWLAYSVDVETTGAYNLDLRLATPLDGRLIHVELDGVDISGNISIPNTGHWNHWETITVPIYLKAGRHILKVVFDQGGCNFNFMEFDWIGHISENVAFIPGIIEAEDYDTGGEGIAYHDSSKGNKGEQYRNDDVDIWYSKVEGHYTGANATGEWLAYSVEIDTSGQYNLDLRIATPRNGRLLRVEMDGVDISGTISIPNTGAWNRWQTITTPIQLKAGWHILKVVFVKGGLNLNMMEIY